MGSRVLGNHVLLFVVVVMYLGHFDNIWDHCKTNLVSIHPYGLHTTDYPPVQRISVHFSSLLGFQYILESFQ